MDAPSGKLDRRSRKIVASALAIYFRLYHRLEVHLPPSLPKQGPFLALTSHFSLLDFAALMVVDPYDPGTTVVVKDSLIRVPILGRLLRAWGVIAVARDGRDVAAVRKILDVLRQERGICIAAQGTRSRDGHLGPIDPVLAGLALHVATRGIPVIPLVELGTYEALPPGAWLPRPYRIQVVAGDPIDLRPWCGKRPGDAELHEVGALIQTRLAELLPQESRPLPGTPALGKPKLATSP